MFWMRNIIPLLFSNWELNVLIAYFLKETKAKRLTLNCIFLHNTWSKVEHFCIINRVFVQRQLWLRNGSFMEVSFATNYSYNGLHFKKYGVRKWRRSRLWNPRWSAELPLLRNIYDYPDALLEMNDLFKRRLQQNTLFVSCEKGPTYEPRPISYRDNLVDYTLRDDVTISHFFIIIISCVQW